MKKLENNNLGWPTIEYLTSVGYFILRVPSYIQNLYVSIYNQSKTERQALPISYEKCEVCDENVLPSV